MSFQNHSEQKMMSEINVTPLVDVMLVLLVVFIVTAPLLTQSIEVKLPKVIATGPASKVRAHRISIDAHGQMRLNDVLTSQANLAEQLSKLTSTRSTLELQIEADTDVDYGKVAQVMAIAQHAGVERLIFVNNTVP